MKATSLKTAAVMAASIGLLAGSAMAQGSAVSGVVGYETLSLGAGFNFVGLRLQESAVAAGDIESATATSVTDTDIADFAAVLGTSGNAGTFILEIESGADNGAIQEVVTWTGDTLNTADTSGVVAGDRYTLRPSATLASVFGAQNESGLTSAGTFGGSDQVWLSDGAGGFNKYYYALGVFGAPSGWKDQAGTSVNPATIDLVYPDGIILNILSAKSVVVTGALKTAATELALGDSFNFLGSVYPVGATLESTFGAANESGLTSAGTFGGSDQVWVPAIDPITAVQTGEFSKYYYALGVFGAPSGWKNQAGTSVDPTTILLTSGYIINNIGGPQALDTSAPAFYSGL